MILGSPLGEEPGWRGFALPRLQRRYWPLIGSLVLGPLWAWWHVPLFFTTWGAPYQIIGIPLALLLFTFMTMGTTIAMTWLFNNTKGSIFLAILFHAAFDSGSTFLSVLYPQMSTSSVHPGASVIIFELLALGLVWAVIVGLVLAFTKGKLSYKPTVE
jgi:membrane protease YdiL (CAAX protease family)